MENLFPTTAPQLAGLIFLLVIILVASLPFLRQRERRQAERAPSMGVPAAELFELESVEWRFPEREAA